MERIPIFKVEDLLLVTIQTDVRDRLLESLQGDIGAKMRDTGARGVLIDISALEVIDHFMARILERIAAVTKLLGAESVIVGMRPAVALTLMELGITFEGVATAVNIEGGMDLLRSGLEPPAEEEQDDDDGDEQEAAAAEYGVKHADRARGPRY